MTKETVTAQDIVTATLNERGSNYGAFIGQATICQDIKDVLRASNNWKILAPDQKECLEMVAHKVARILNGNPNFLDSWLDLSGYTKLVYDRLSTKNTVG